jgi:hypothetical protein
MEEDPILSALFMGLRNALTILCIGSMRRGPPDRKAGDFSIIELGRSSHLSSEM